MKNIALAILAVGMMWIQGELDVGVGTGVLIIISLAATIGVFVV